MDTFRTPCIDPGTITCWCQLCRTKGKVTLAANRLPTSSSVGHQENVYKSGQNAHNLRTVKNLTLPDGESGVR
jgi:hypothetical protein